MDLGDGLHFLNASNTDFGDPEGAADVGPQFSRFSGLHGPALVGTELALGRDVQFTGLAQPGTRGDGGDAVTGLMYANVALVTEHHFIAFFAVGL